MEKSSYRNLYSVTDYISRYEKKFISQFILGPDWSLISLTICPFHYLFLIILLVTLSLGLLVFLLWCLYLRAKD